MLDAKILEFGAVPDWRNLAFPDLRRRLENHLDTIRTLPDLETLLQMLNPMLKSDDYSPDERAVLRRLRQRAYDRKRHPKFQTDADAPSVRLPAAELKFQIPDLQVQTKPSAQTTTDLDPKTQTPGKGTIMTECQNTVMPAYVKTKTFSEGVMKALSHIDGERFIKTAPTLLAWSSAAVLVSYFLWQQSVDLYESAGFKDSLWASAGGILMIIGFAACHSLTRSTLALLLCLYASGYEAYLMISGTIENEHQLQIQTVQNHPDLVFLKEKAAKSLAHYHELKERYDDPESKVFKNDWFAKNHLTPAWQESAANHGELMAKEAALSGEKQSGHITWLKILYRLGLVFLCMMLVHRTFAVANFKKCSSPSI